jgi:hypothetical protein
MAFFETDLHREPAVYMSLWGSPRGKVPPLPLPKCDKKSFVLSFMNFSPWGGGERSRPSCSHPEQGPAPNGFVDRPNGDLGGGGLPDTPSAGGAGLPFSPRCALPRRPRTSQVCRRTHSRWAPGKSTPPHGRWGGVRAWGSPVQGEVRMVPLFPTATKRPFP